ncbi:MAG TPA: hypothetical protein VE596_12460 [Gaiellaceae bacterium]|jgi:hypothetical protein|nr:hypothetical protein [Gaiellaceae bacterium]
MCPEVRRSEGKVSLPVYAAGDHGRTLFFGDKAAAGAIEAVVRHRGAEHRVPVESGFFVFVQWNVADGDWDQPELVGFA